METKTMAAAFAVALLVLAGAAFAMPNWFGGFFGGQPQSMQNNETGHILPGRFRMKNINKNKERGDIS